MANRRSLAACWLAAGLALALVTQTAVAGPVTPRAQTVKNTPHRQPLDKPIPVKEVPVAQRQPSATDKAALKETPAVTWPAAGSTTLTPARTASGRATSVAGKAGGLPLQVAPVGTPASVRVDLLDRAATAKAGIAGLLLRVRRTDSKAAGKVVLGLDYSGFANAYGADWGSRLQFRRLSDGKTLGTNNARTSRLSAEIPAAGAESLYAVTAAPAGQGGNYAATSLALSGEWSTSGQTGEFTWNYGLRVPEVPGGLSPQLALSYSSGAVDGRTASTNNQSSWIGEGFDMWSGYIERNYRGCNDDKTGSSTTEDTGDQCWFSDNATLSLGGHSGPLVKVGTSNSWRLQNDDGTLIERAYGAENGDNDKEYWKVTTADGTQYYFGRNRLPNWPADKQTNSTWLAPVFGNNKNEPCENGAYASSWCNQAYRWNLDHVVDRHGNTMTYYYEKERNSYGLNRGRTTIGYDRGGVLVRAEYGTRLGSEVPGTAPASVVFGTEDRCLRGAACSTANKADYPDTPLDQTCTANCTTLVSPTFFTTKRLTSVTTRVGATEVEKWSLRQTFPSPGDSTSPSLWLAGITHHGLTGTKVSLPEVTFGGEPRDNRVNADNDVTFPMVKYRVDEIKNEYGGIIAVTYAPADCTTTTLPVAWDNKKRCFPVYWQPDGSPAMNDWFHKYVVASVVQQDPIAGSPAEQTTYQYLDGGAWNYSENELVKPERRTWSEWRGYQRVVTTHGDPADTDTPLGKTEYRYYRGMNGDRLNNSGGVRSAEVQDSTGGKVADEPWLNGRVREQLTFDGPTGPVIGGTITDTWQRGPTATQGILKAYMVQTGAVRERNALPEGKWRETRINRSYYDDGLVATIEDLGDVGTAADDECSTTTYARASTSAVTGLPAQVKTVNKACSAQASAGDLISDVHTYYDNSTVDGFIGAKGDATSVRQLSGVKNGVAEYITATRTSYDAYGRPLETTDALGNKTSTAYVETGGLTSKITITNALGQKTVTDLDTKWGEPVIATEPSGNRTDVTYDSLGRVLGVWLPGRSGKSGYAPNMRYGYHVRDTGPTAVSTETLRAGGNLLTSYALYDGFLRSRQTQSPGWGEGGVVQGRVVSETSYNSRGMVKTATGQYYAEGSPGTTLVAAGENNQPSQTDTKYDAMGRAIKSTFRSKAVDLWSSSTQYLGDRVKYTPPAGGTATTSFLDADGKTTELQQHRGPLPEGPADITKYTYARGGQLATVTDPAGNQWRYQYDVQGRQIAAHDPDKGDLTSTFDVGGRLLTTTDARGKTLAYEYDVLGRKTKEREGSATGAVRATWVYDTLKPGLPTSSSRTEGTVTYTSSVLGYDDAGRPTGTRMAIPAAETGVGGNYDTLMTYRADGSPDTVTMPRVGDLPAETLSYDYDGLGLQDTLKSGTGTAYVNDTWYTRFGELAHTSMGAVGKMVWNNLYYDAATRRLDQNLVERESGGPAEVNDFRFDYDAVGNVTRIADVPDGGPADRQCFSYDYLRRMTEAWTPTATCGTPEVGGTSSPYWTSYRYDVVGNRTSEVQHAQAGNTTRTYSVSGRGPATAACVDLGVDQWSCRVPAGQHGLRHDRQHDQPQTQRQHPAVRLGHGWADDDFDVGRWQDDHDRVRRRRQSADPPGPGLDHALPGRAGTQVRQDHAGEDRDPVLLVWGVGGRSTDWCWSVLAVR